jgi:hypothetical protein
MRLPNVRDMTYRKEKKESWMPNPAGSSVLTSPNPGVEGRHEPPRRAAIARPLRKAAMRTPLCMSFHGPTCGSPTRFTVGWFAASSKEAHCGSRGSKSNFANQRLPPARRRVHRMRKNASAKGGATGDVRAIEHRWEL